MIGNSISLIFRYKYGYDFRRMVVLERYFFRNVDEYTRLVGETATNDNVTKWLEFVLEATAKELKDAIVACQTISHQKNHTLLLSKRQKTILEFLDNPHITISNRQVRKKCVVSAITAARDLVGLVKYGLILPVGKGRSVQYVRT